LKGFFKGGKDTGPNDFMNINKMGADLDALEENMEQNEKEQANEEKERNTLMCLVGQINCFLAVNLGRIQYKLDYDFQQGQVLN
jgi:hypothetical protein